MSERVVGRLVGIFNRGRDILPARSRETKTARLEAIALALDLFGSHPRVDFFMENPFDVRFSNLAQRHADYGTGDEIRVSGVSGSLWPETETDNLFVSLCVAFSRPGGHSLTLDLSNDRSKVEYARYRMSYGDIRDRFDELSRLKVINEVLKVLIELKDADFLSQGKGAVLRSPWERVIEDPNHAHTAAGRGLFKELSEDELAAMGAPATIVPLLRWPRKIVPPVKLPPHVRKKFS